MLWIELTIPAPDDSDPNSSDFQGDDLAVILLVIDECVRTADGEGNLATYAAAKTYISSATAISTDVSRRYAKPTAPSILLCDAARHERSGVQRF
jgi:hypothetical protein